jgi:hypothetical protein
LGAVSRVVVVIAKAAGGVVPVCAAIPPRSGAGAVTPAKFLAAVVKLLVVKV